MWSSQKESVPDSLITRLDALALKIEAHLNEVNSIKEQITLIEAAVAECLEGESSRERRFTSMEADVTDLYDKVGRQLRKLRQRERREEQVDAEEPTGPQLHDPQAAKAALRRQISQQG